MWIQLHFVEVVFLSVWFLGDRRCKYGIMFYLGLKMSGMVVFKTVVQDILMDRKFVLIINIPYSTLVLSLSVVVTALPTEPPKWLPHSYFSHCACFLIQCQPCLQGVLHPLQVCQYYFFILDRLTFHPASSKFIPHSCICTLVIGGIMATASS